MSISATNSAGFIQGARHYSYKAEWEDVHTEIHCLGYEHKQHLRHHPVKVVKTGTYGMFVWVTFRLIRFKECKNVPLELKWRNFRITMMTTNMMYVRAVLMKNFRWNPKSKINEANTTEALHIIHSDPMRPMKTTSAGSFRYTLTLSTTTRD